MKPRRPTAIFAALAALLLASLACNAPAPSPTADLVSIVARTQTAIALDVFLTSTAAAQKLSPQVPPAQALTTLTPITQITNSGATLPPGATPITPPALTLVPGATTISDCSDAAKFEAETIPDDTPFPPGATFVKTWTLRNVGTCTWSNNYALIFDKGERMDGTSPTPLGAVVQPNGTIQIYLPQTAPQTPGEYQGFWKLRNPQGQTFGLGKNADVAFWIKILVQPGAAVASTPSGSRGAPTWKVTFQSKNSPFYLGTDTDIDFRTKDSYLVMTAINPDGDQWRVAQNSNLGDFYIETQFVTGDTCNGKDSYGMLVRAPEKANGVINSGYVFGFSCDGKYRAYRMDNGNYTGIINWTANPSVKAGPKQANIMGIRAKGSDFQLYANGTLVYQFSDSTFSSGLYGLMIRSETTPNFQVAVKEIDYWNQP